MKHIKSRRSKGHTASKGQHVNGNEKQLKKSNQNKRQREKQVASKK